MATTASQPEIVPRWEWRAFGDRFDTADDILGSLEVDRVRESDEVYLLSTRSDASVKVRDALMDVKHLVRVDDDGLELWTPVLKAAFPLPASDVESVLTTMGVPLPTLGRDAYSLAEVETDVIAPNPDLIALRLNKRRTHYDVDGCTVESTDLRTGDTTTRTVVVESSDPALVSATVHKLGLGERRNVNMARGLKALVGFGSRRYAVIDVGTNSVKFHLGERRADGTLHTVVDRAAVTRLGEGLSDSGRIGDEAAQRTLDAIAAMVDEARREGAVDLAAVGTAGLRIASNRDEFLAAVAARSDISVEVVSGEEEARLAYLAAMSALPLARGAIVVFDSGGGSSQFTFGHGPRVDERFSVDVGAVRIAERHGLASAVPPETLDAVAEALDADLDRLDGRPAPDAVVAMGGTATNLAAVKHALARYDADVVNGTVLDLAEIDRQIEIYRTRDAEERRSIDGLQPERAEVILAGACIVRCILDKLGRPSLTVCDRGLRHGLAVERFAG